MILRMPDGVTQLATTKDLYDYYWSSTDEIQQNLGSLMTDAVSDPSRYMDELVGNVAKIGCSVTESCTDCSTTWDPDSIQVALTKDSITIPPVTTEGFKAREFPTPSGNTTVGGKSKTQTCTPYDKSGDLYGLGYGVPKGKPKVKVGFPEINKGGMNTPPVHTGLDDTHEYYDPRRWDPTNAECMSCSGRRNGRPMTITMV